MKSWNMQLQFKMVLNKKTAKASKSMVFSMSLSFVEKFFKDLNYRLKV